MNEENPFPSNQEAYMSQQCELDSSDDDSDIDNLATTDVSDTKNPSIPLDIAVGAIKAIDKLSDERLELAKAREGIAYGISSDKLPPYCHFNVKCAPDVRNVEINEIVNSAITNIIEDTKKEFLRKVLNELDTIMLEKTNCIKATRKEAKDQIGKKTKSAGEARTMLTKKLEEIKNRNDKIIAEFKADIRFKRLENPVHDSPRWNVDEPGSSHGGHSSWMGRGRNGKRWYKNQHRGPRPY